MLIVDVALAFTLDGNEEGSTMNRKLINLIALFSTILLLTGCTGSADSDRTVSVLATGPNDLTTSSFYRIVKNADEFKYGAIVKMEVNTASDTVVYQPEKSLNTSSGETLQIMPE